MYRLHEDVEVQGVYNELMDMTAEEARNEMISRIRMMTSGERADTVVYLYELDIIDRDRFRELLGIEEKSYNERAGLDVRKRSAADSDDVDTAVLIKPGILCRCEGVFDILRQTLDLYRNAVIRGVHN